jgi:hypothetical protein
MPSPYSPCDERLAHERDDKAGPHFHASNTVWDHSLPTGRIRRNLAAELDGRIHAVDA